MGAAGVRRRTAVATSQSMYKSQIDLPSLTNVIISVTHNTRNENKLSFCHGGTRARRPCLQGG
jgi:hypothetical protein